MNQESVTRPPRLAKRRLSPRTTMRIIGAAVLLLVIGGAIGIAAALLTKPKAQIPAIIQSNAPFKPHLPSHLPGSYRVEQSSINLSENQKVLAYHATDNSGTTISFTEQKRPRELDFSDIYSQRLSNAQKISGSKYESVFGIDTASNLLTISVLTDNTWILITTEASLSDADIRTIVGSI